MTATTDSTRNSITQLLDDQSLDGVVAGLDCNTAHQVARADYAAGHAMRAAGQSWVAYGLEGKSAGVQAGACSPPA